MTFEIPDREDFCDGDKVVLKCLVKSLIPVTLNWLKNGELIKEMKSK
jgi:hypothetical protein